MPIIISRMIKNNNEIRKLMKLQLKYFAIKLKIKTKRKS